MASSGCQAQVALKGVQDIYLISPSDDTFWKTEYTRHTNFAVGEIDMPFMNTPGFGRQKFSANAQRAGDLLVQMYVVCDLPRIVYPKVNDQFQFFDPSADTYVTWVNAFGHALFNDISVSIGNQMYDTQLSEFMEAWESLSAPANRELGKIIGRYSDLSACALAALRDQTLYVPLRFWFNRFNEQALPLVALYWHDVNFTFSTKPLSQLYIASNVGAGDISVGEPSATKVYVPNAVNDMHLLCNLVYLDRPERAAFANSRSEYIIDQVQFLGSESINTTSNQVNHSIRFNHPIQELIWVYRRTEATAANDWFNFWGNSTRNDVIPETLVTDPFRSASILINNHVRTQDMPAVYYRTIQPLQAHSRIPSDDRAVYCYSFALKPEEMLHNGSVNMSRMDNATLRVTYHSDSDLTPAINGSIFIFARNKNVIKVTVGMAGTKFAA